MDSKDSAIPRFLIFLDFDGVLHPVNAQAHERFRPDAIRIVNEVLAALKAQVVLSTAWRMEFADSGKTLTEAQVNQWFGERVVGSTPVAKLNMTESHTRFREIMKFLESADWLRVPWIAIDDKASHFPANAPAYITNRDTGITEADGERIIRIGHSMRFAQWALLRHLKKTTGKA